MSDTKPATQNPVATKAKRERSPSFPFIPLKTAIERLAALDAYSNRHPVPAKHSGAAWGYKGYTSQAMQTLAALKAFGLISYRGSGDSLEAVLSEDGRTYLRAQQESIKEEILKRVAIKPKALATYFSKWGTSRPNDAICLDELVLKGGFNATGAKTFLSVYDETISYAGLSNSDKKEAAETASSPEGEDDGQIEEEASMDAQPVAPEKKSGLSWARTASQSSQSPPLAAPPIGKPRIIMNGDHLDIHASVDLAGLKQLQTMLKKYEEILEMMAPEKDEAAN